MNCDVLCCDIAIVCYEQSLIYNIEASYNLITGIWRTIPSNSGMVKFGYYKIVTFFLFLGCKLLEGLKKATTYTVVTHSMDPTDMSLIVGPDHLRRIETYKTIKNCKKIEEAKLEHRRLHDLVAKLDVPKSSHMYQELKILKAEKLHVKDKIKRLVKETSSSYVPRVNDTILGAGGFGKVLFGHCSSSGFDVAIKVASPNDFATVWKEYLILQKLHDPGFPRVHYFGEQLLQNYGETVVLVMDILGPSLEKLLFATTLGAKGFSGPTVLKLSIELLCRLRSLSKHDIVHGDIQPGNFLVGKGPNDNHTLYLIDFGLSSMPSLEKTNPDTSSSISSSRHYSLPQSTPPADSTTEGNTHKFHYSTTTTTSTTTQCETVDIISGTAAFSSSSVLSGARCGERDDLESLAYSLAYLLQGSLPWDAKIRSYDSDSASDCLTEEENIERVRLAIQLLVAQKKSCCSYIDLFGVHESELEHRGNFPVAQFILEILHYARSLPIGTKPDYSKLLKLADDAALALHITHKLKSTYSLTHGVKQDHSVPSVAAGENSGDHSKVVLPYAESALWLVSRPFDWEAAGIKWSPVNGAIVHASYT